MHSRRTPSNGNRSCDQSCTFPIGSYNLSQCCEPSSEERSAGNPHATFCVNRARATASGDPVAHGNGRPYRDRSSHLDPRSDFSTSILPSTTPSTINDISSLGPHFGFSEANQLPSGKMRLLLHETRFDLAGSLERTLTVTKPCVPLSPLRIEGSSKPHRLRTRASMDSENAIGQRTRLK